MPARPKSVRAGRTSPLPSPPPVPVRAALDWAICALAARSRAVACASTARASSKRFCGAAPALTRRSARSRSRVSQLNRGRRLSSRLLELRQFTRHRRWGEQSRELLSLLDRTPWPKRDNLNQSAIDWRHDFSRSTRTGNDCCRHANRFAKHALLGERRSEVERPLLLFQKADAFAFRWGALDRLACGLLIGVDDHIRDAMLIGEARRFQRNHEHPVSGARRLHIDAENSRASMDRRRGTSQGRRCPAAALPPAPLSRP